MEWPLVRLDSLYDIARGGSPRPIKDYITEDPNGINWIKIGDATASGKFIYETKQKIKQEGIQRSRLVNKGDFILSNSMSFGRPYIMGTSGCIHDGWLVLSAKDERIDQDFLYHMLGSPFVFSQFDALAAGSTVRNLNIELVSRVKIPLLPLAEQKRIVALLDTVFADLEQTRSKTEQNLKNARDLFDSYLQQVFSQKGEGWVEKSIEDITTKLGDGLHGTPKYSEDGEYYFINGNNLNDGVIEFKERTKKVSEIEFDKYKKTLNDRTILVSINGTLGNVAFYNNEKVVLGKSACYFNLKEDINKEYVKFVIESQIFQDYAERNATGATIKNVSLKSMRAFLVPIAPTHLQSEIVSELNQIKLSYISLDKIYKAKLVALDELKKSILQKAFSGELTTTTK
ncbi:restriction endonuclease subunit S [Thalassotalea agariperforans]